MKTLVSSGQPVASGGAVWLRRSRLERTLGRHTPITILRAPIGFGKSILARQFAIEASAWSMVVTVRTPEMSTEDGPAGFWRALYVELRAAGLEDGEEFDGSADGVARVLNGLDGDLVIVIESYDDSSQPETASRLVSLVRANPCLHLVVCCRQTTVLEHLAGLEWDVSVLDRDILALNSQELVSLAARRSLKVSPALAEALVDRLGGWPALANAAVSALSEEAGIDDLETGMQAARQLLEILIRVLPLGESDLDELASVSLLPFFSEQDILAIHGPHAAGLLRLIASGLVSNGPEACPGTWQISSAVRDLMHRRLEARGHTELAALRERAMVRAFANESAEEALDLARQIGDWKRVAQALDRWWPELLAEGKFQGVVNAVYEFPDTLRAKWAVVGLLSEYFRLSTGPETQLQLPTEDAQLRRLGARPDGQLVLRRIILAMAVLRRRGDFASAADLADRGESIADAAMYGAHSRQSMFPMWHVHSGISAYMAGDNPAAMRRWRAAYDRREADDLGFVATDAPSKMAMVCAFEGDLASAEIWRRRGQLKLPKDTWVENATTVSLRVAAVIEACERLDRVGADEAVNALPSPLDESEEFWAEVLVAVALHARLFGDVGTAMNLVLEAKSRRAVMLSESGVAAGLLAAAEAALAISLGQASRADAVLKSASRSPGLSVLRARLELRSGDALAARAELARGSGLVQVSHTSRAEMAVLHMAVAHDLGDLPTAVDYAGTVCDLASRHGLIRPLVDVRREILEKLSAEVSRLSPLLEVLEGSGVGDPSARPLELVTLTDREHVVLKQLASGDKLKAIADALVVSINTVQSQRRSLYRKLGVTDRRGALTRAGELGLISTSPRSDRSTHEM